MSVNRIKARIVVENQRVGTVNLRGGGPSEAVIPPIRNCRICDQIAPIDTSVMFSSKLVMGPGTRPERIRSTPTCCLRTEVGLVYFNPAPKCRHCLAPRRGTEGRLIGTAFQGGDA